jgi:hypothetical protein
MATVQIADIYNPLVFAQAAQEAQVELNAFIRSGVARTDSMIQSMAATGGNIGELPFYVPLTNSEPNYSSDVAGTASTPENISSAKMTYRLASQNNSWAVMDLASELALADPAQAITNRIGQYWATINERRAIESIRGLIADNIANDSGDMIFDISATVDTASTDANLVDRDAIIDAIQTMGDHGRNVKVMGVHSRVLSHLKKIDALNFTREKESDTGLTITRYAGMEVVEDDSLAGITYGTTPVNTYFDTVFFAKGAFASEMGKVLTPSELDRDPSSGNGGGQTLLYSRRSDIIHPYGFEFTSSSVAGQSATWAELSAAANWNRVYTFRKNVPIAVLRSNG